MSGFRTGLFACVALAASVAVGERQPFSRYQTILDRQMFGQPPPGFDPTRPASEVAKASGRPQAELTREQEQVKSAIHFSAINVTPSGETAVGFTDNGDSKNPVHYYLKVGESRNGWTVREADAAKATMTIAKGEVEVSLSLGGSSGGAPASGGGKGRSAGTAASRSGLGRSSPRPAGGGSLANRPGGLLSTSSLRGRRMMREQQRQQEAADRAAEENRRAEEKRAAEEEKQRQAEEREQQRQQLLQIRDELQRAREARQAREAEDSAKEGEEASE